MESPLAVFLYLLMREHLPVATVKWMIDQAKLPGDPKKIEAPELEVLADRLAKELGDHLEDRPEAAGQNGAGGGHTPPSPPPAADPPPRPRTADKRRTSQETVDAFLAFLRERGGRCKPGDFDELGKSNATRARVVRELRADSKVHVSFDGRQRMIVLTPEGCTCKWAPLEGKPADHREPDPNCPVHPARAGETDIELMARASDYIREATDRGEVVWPRELEQHFNIDARRRAKIVELLVERQRIVVRKPNSPHVHYEYRRGSGDPDFRFDHEVDAGGEGNLHLKDPDVERRVEAIAERDESERFIVSNHMETIRAWARGAGNFTARQVREVFKVSAPTSHRIVTALTEEGFIEQIGKEGLSGIFAVAGRSNGSKSSTDRPGKRPLHAGGDGSTLDGRALGIIDGSGGLTVPEVAARLGVEEAVARALIGKLYREGEVRPQRQEGTVRYVIV